MLVIALVVLLNARLYHTSSIQVVDGDTVSMDLLHEPRGFKNPLTMAQTKKRNNYIPKATSSECHSLFVEGRSEIQKSWQKIDSDQGRGPFDEDLPLPFGAFNTGWSNYFLGRKLTISFINNFGIRLA